MIVIHNNDDIVAMRLAGKLAAEVLDYVTPFVVAGVTTNELDLLCHEYITKIQLAIPAPLNYKINDKISPYPKSICTSVNYEVCHGIPSDRILKNGDIVNIDVTVIKDGYHGDTSRMFLIGNVSSYAERLSRVTKECLYLGIETVRDGAYLGDIGYAIENHAHANGYSVVREFCGHGIGKVFHADPQVLHYGRKNTGERLLEGMIFTIEPMINQGKKDIKMTPNQWTAVTKDKSLSAQWEHTILVTKNGYEILTLSNTKN